MPQTYLKVVFLTPCIKPFSEWAACLIGSVPSLAQIISLRLAQI